MYTAFVFALYYKDSYIMVFKVNINTGEDSLCVKYKYDLFIIYMYIYKYIFISYLNVNELV